MTLIASLGGRNFWKGMTSGFFGLMLALVGTDNTAGITRLTFDIPELISGFSLLPVLVGLFALPSLIGGLNKPTNVVVDSSVKTNELRIPYKTVFKRLKENWGNLIRSSAFGALVGALPGEGGSVANFLAYDQAKRYSKHPELFGTGCPDGVVASESGNNACAGGGLIPTLALGIPGSAADAVLLGVLMVHSIPTGPSLFKENASLVYALFVVFFIAHFFMLALQLGIGSRVFLRIVQCPQWALVPIVLLMCAIGCYALNNQTFDIWLFLLFGIVGYLMDKAGFPLAPVVIGLLLGGMFEDNLRQAFSISSDWKLFFTRPISAFFMLLTALSILYCAWQYRKEKITEKSAKSLKKENRNIVWLSFGISLAFIALCAFMFKETLSLPPASKWDLIGSRLTPQIVIGCMAVCSFVTMIMSIIRLSQSQVSATSASVISAPICVVFVSLGLWFLAIPYFGFYITAIVFLYFLCWYMKNFKFDLALLMVPPVTIVIIYWVFTLFLRLQLPESMLFS